MRISSLFADALMILVVTLSSLYLSISVNFESLESLADSMELVLADDKDQELVYSIPFRDSGECYVVDAVTQRMDTPSRFPERFEYAKGYVRTYTVDAASRENAIVQTIQADYGGVWVLSRAEPVEFYGKPKIVVAEIDLSEVMQSVAWQVAVVVALIVGVHWVTSAASAKRARKNADFELLNGLMRWISSFPDDALLVVDSSTKRIIECNKESAEFFGVEYASLLIGRRIDTLLVDFDLPDNLTPVSREGTIDMIGRESVPGLVYAQAISADQWIVRVRHATRQKDELTTSLAGAS